MDIKKRAEELATWTKIENGKYNPEIDRQVYNACLRIAIEQRKEYIEKSLAYWHGILDKSGISQNVFADYAEAMDKP